MFQIQINLLINFIFLLINKVFYDDHEHETRYKSCDVINLITKEYLQIDPLERQIAVCFIATADTKSTQGRVVLFSTSHNEDLPTTEGTSMIVTRIPNP